MSGKPVGICLEAPQLQAGGGRRGAVVVVGVGLCPSLRPPAAAVLSNGPFPSKPMGCASPGAAGLQHLHGEIIES